MTIKGFLTKIKEFMAYSKSRYNIHLDDNIYYELSGYKARFMNFLNIFTSLINLKSSKIIIGSRIVEKPFLYQNIDLENTYKIMDLGCVGSKISIELASMGLEVVGVDYRPYSLKHKNLKFIQGNFLDLEFTPNSFDCVIAISTIEHIGLPAYNITPIKDGDKKAGEKIYRLLKKKGKFIITVPYGRNILNSFERNYSFNSLVKLLKDFQILTFKIYEKSKNGWIESNKNLSSSQKVACIVCIKE